MRARRSFFFNDTATTEIYTLSLHDALPICSLSLRRRRVHRADSLERGRDRDAGAEAVDGRTVPPHGRRGARHDDQPLSVFLAGLPGSRGNAGRPTPQAAERTEK